MKEVTRLNEKTKKAMHEMASLFLQDNKEFIYISPRNLIALIEEIWSQKACIEAIKQTVKRVKNELS